MRLTLILILLSCSLSYGQKKTLDATRISSHITIDGISDEEAWKGVPTATDFTTLSPVPGQSPKQQTEVKVLYDDDAIYISAFMEEVSRDSILTELTQRDDVGNTDAFFVILDTYGNGTDGILLLVGATGVQYDALKGNNGNEDSDWDAVWFSGVHLTEEGWTCEMKIPYSAIRFPNQKSQEWTINFMRAQRRTNIRTSWAEIDPEINGLFTQSGILKNIEDIKSPIRLSFSPYLSTYATHYHDKNAIPVNSTGYSYNAGMDVKYGINDAFTLDMTLVPDFGQVESDDLVVNLSPFEVQLSEKRPFFTEGLDMFSKADIFYTRRVGGSALNFGEIETEENETLIANPQIPQLYNATKISGRNNNGLGIGLFNAVEAKTEAVVENNETKERTTTTTQPLTNYSVVVLDKNLKNNSFISVINTNVWRKGSEFYDANVIATEFDLKDKNQKYSISGGAAFSKLNKKASEKNTGHQIALELDKISGRINSWVDYNEVSPNYDHNDLGFLYKANYRELSIGTEFKIFDPTWIINRGNFWIDVEYSRIIDPNVYTDTHFNWGFWTELKNFWNVNMWMNYGTEKKDYFEPRTEDFSRFVLRPVFYNMGFWVGTDNRKKMRMNFNGNIYNLDEADRWGYAYSMGVRYRFSDRFTVSTNGNFNIQKDDTGWVEDGTEGEIYFGQRDLRRVTTFLNSSYTFNDKMGLNLRLRHNWVTAAYNSFHELAKDGSLPISDYSAELDFSNTYFTIDLGYNWNFAPGSDLSLVWKNNISGYTDDPTIDFRNRNYLDGVNALGEFPQQNSLSLRITYFLDSTNIKNIL